MAGLSCSESAGIELPIILAPMAGAALSELAIAVAKPEDLDLFPRDAPGAALPEIYVPARLVHRTVALPPEPIRASAISADPAADGHRRHHHVFAASLGAPVILRLLPARRNPCGDLREMFGGSSKGSSAPYETLLSAMGNIQTGRLLDPRFLDLEGNRDR